MLVSNERQIYSEEPRGVNSISHQKYLELCADERIRFGSCNTVTAALADNFTAEIMDGQEKMEQKIFMWRDHLILSSILVLFLL